MSTTAQIFAAGLFQARRVIVSGGNSGIGRAIALGFAEAGAYVTVLGTRPVSAPQPQAHDGGGSLAQVQLDVTAPDAVAQFCETQGPVDVLVNAAGVARPSEEWDVEGFEGVVNVNLLGSMRLTYGLLERLRQTGGTVLNIASMLSYVADENVPAYAASKSGVLGFTRSLAHKLGKHGVRVNALAPGYHQTEMTAGLRDNAQGWQNVIDRTALKRWGTADDLVGAAMFLASPAASYITGTCLVVDGGFVVGNPLVKEIDKIEAPLGA